MNGVYKHYIIDMSCNNNFVQVPTVQGDGNNVRGFEVELISNNVQYVVDEANTIVSIAGTKPDTKQILNECKVTPEGYILVDITSQMAAVPGRGDYSIVLMDKNTNSQLKSFPFYILTTASAFDPGNIISSDEFQLLTSTITATKKLEEDIAKLKVDLEVSEQERVDNETIREENEADRIATMQGLEQVKEDAIEATNRANDISTDLENKVATDYYRGNPGKDGTNGKDGIITTVPANHLAFSIVDGNLIVTYEDGNTDANKFSIDSTGHLIYTFN